MTQENQVPQSEEMPDDYQPMSPEKMKWHLASIRLMEVIYGHKKAYVECSEKDKEAEIGGKPVRELDVNPGLEWQKRRVKLTILSWLALHPSATNEEFRKFIFSDQFDKYGI